MQTNLKNIIWVSLLLVSGLAKGQGKMDKDTLAYSLLRNPFIQVESTEAVNSMYNFEFQKAQSHFNYLQKKYPWHPLPYLLKGLNYWWQIVPNYEETEYDKAFIAYMDTTKVLAQSIKKKYNEIEGSFFLAAAYAFEGRLYAERREYRKAALAGSRSLKYLKECQGHEDYSPELLFGDALFNYYAQWIREEYPLLRPLMMFFPRGDKKLGIEQLITVTRNAFYSRTEAQFYLMRILSSAEDRNLPEALRVGKILREDYPNNPYFHRYYARLLYQAGKRSDAVNESLQILQNIDSGKAGYEANSGRYACFFLGQVCERQNNDDEAKKYYEKGLVYAEEANATKMGYYFYSLLHLGKIAKRQGEDKLAKKYFKKVKSAAKRSHDAHKEARKELRSFN